jgi:hypothetical protein
MYYFWPVLILILTAIAFYFLSDKSYSKQTLKESLKVGINKDSKITYANGDSITYYQAWKGHIEPGSVFHPGNPWWYFDISGLDMNGKLIFSTGWHKDLILSQTIPPFDTIKKWQITIATNISTKPPSDAYQKLRIE